MLARMADSPVPDSRVSAAVSHWAPRFVANGIDYNDFVRVTSAIETWGSWCEQWCAAGAVHEKLGRDALAAGRRRSAGAHLSQAAVYYHFAKFMFVDDIDQMRAAHLMAVRCAGEALPFLDPPGERVEIPFDGATIAAVLRRPDGSGPHPAVVLIPGLDSAKEEFRPTEDLFLSRGIATLSVGGPGRGHREHAEWAARHRSGPDWDLGSKPRRLLRRPGRQRRCCDPRLHLALPDLLPRRYLGPAARSSA